MGRDRVQGEARQHRQLHEHPAHERARVHRPEVHERPGPDSDSVRLTFLFLFDISLCPAREMKGGEAFVLPVDIIRQ